MRFRIERKEVFNNGKFHENFQNKLNATAASDIILHYYLTSSTVIYIISEHLDVFMRMYFLILLLQNISNKIQYIIYAI